VPNRLNFTVKVSGAVIASNSLAALIYWFQTPLPRRKTAPEIAQDRKD
jgi:hypothetical protein